MRKYKRDFVWMGVLLLLPVLFFAPVVLGAKTLLPADVLYQFQPYRALHHISPHNPLLGDLVLENYAWKHLLIEAFHTHQLPLWDPYVFAGHPFLANGQHSALYPLTWMFFFIPPERAFGVFLAIQLGLAGAAMYVLGRVWGARRLGALLSGITFQFSGFLIASAVHPMIVASAAWLPLLLAAVDLTVRRAKVAGQRTALPWALLGAIALGLQSLAGHAEALYLSLLVTGAYAVWRLVAAGLSRGWRTVRSAAFALGLMFTLGLGLGAVQLLPLYEVASSSFRQNAASLSQVLGWAYPKRRIITFLVPNFFGNPAHHTLRDVFSGEIVRASVNSYGQQIGAFDWGLKNYVEGAAYVGILPLLLTVVAVLRPPHGRRWWQSPVAFLTMLSLFALGCIFGTPIYALVYHLPFLSQSHTPFRWVFPLTVALSALAGLGATTVAEMREEGLAAKGHAHPRGLWRVLLFDTSPNLVTWLAAAAIWLGAGGLMGLWASRRFYPAIAPWVERAFHSLAMADRAFPSATAFYSYLFPWLQAAAIFMLSAGIVLRVSRCPIYLPRRLGRRPAWEVLAVLALLADLWTVGAGFNPADDPALLHETPPVVTFLKQQPGVWRFSTFDPQGKGTMVANCGMFYDLQDVRGYDSLFSAQYARYMGWIEPQGALPYNRIAPFTSWDSLNSPLLDMLNVKYILTEEVIPLPKYKQVYQDDAVRVYENLGVAPRAFTLPGTATVAVDEDAVGETLQHYDPRAYVIVETSQVQPLSGIEPWPGTLRPQKVASYGLSEVYVDVQIDAPSWLVLTDSYAPGWKAFVRPPGSGQEAETEVPIVRVAGNFRGVWLEHGATVRFKYSPNSVKVGAFVSFLAGMTLLFFAGLWGWRRVYRETGTESTVQRVAKNSIAPIVLEAFNWTINLAFAALMLRLLGPANAGAYYYATMLFVWLDILSNFGLDAYLMREVPRHRAQANRYLVNSTVIRLAAAAAGLPLLGGFIAVRMLLVSPPLSTQTLAAIALLYLGLLPGTISKGLTALFYAYEKAEYPAAVSSLSMLLKVTLGMLALMVGWGIVGLAGMSVVINLITLTILTLLSTRFFFRPAWEPDAALRREMVRESWPLMVNHLLATVFYKGDVVLLEANRGSTEVGWYSFGYKILDVYNIVPARFTMAIFPVVSRQAHEDRAALMRFYRLGVKLLFTLALPLAVVTTLIARELVLVLGSSAYLPHSQIALQIMIWSIPFGWINSLTNYVLIALDRQRYLTKAYLLAVAFNVGANLVFIPRYGYPASAVITILSEAVLLLPFAWGIRREVGSVGWWSIIRTPLLAVAVAGGVAVMLLPLSRWGAALGAGIVYPIVLWRAGLLTDEEERLLKPILRRS